jgi:N-acetylglutamate synthase-like GNAT family acetyltransferase
MSENYAILGPGGALNNSLRRQARKLVKETVLKSYFRKTWNNRNRSQNYAIMNENGQFSGFAIVKKNGDRLTIPLIGAKQGKGIGSQLMQRIINNAENRGINRINLNSVPNALKFYRKFGFDVISANNEHIMMKLNLARRSPSPSPSPNRKSPSPVPKRKSPTPSPVPKTQVSKPSSTQAEALSSHSRTSKVIQF